MLYKRIIDASVKFRLQTIVPSAYMTLSPLKGKQCDLATVCALTQYTARAPYTHAHKQPRYTTGKFKITSKVLVEPKNCSIVFY
jgi:hypothetical protein